MQVWGVAVAWCTQTSDLHLSQSIGPCLSPPLSCGTTVAFLIGSNVCTPAYLSKRKRWLVIQEMSTVIERKGDVPGLCLCEESLSLPHGQWALGLGNLEGRQSHSPPLTVLDLKS